VEPRHGLTEQQWPVCKLSRGPDLSCSAYQCMPLALTCIMRRARSEPRTKGTWREGEIWREGEGRVRGRKPPDSWRLWRNGPGRLHGCCVSATLLSAGKRLCAL